MSSLDDWAKRAAERQAAEEHEEKKKKLAEQADFDRQREFELRLEVLRLAELQKTAEFKQMRAIAYHPIFHQALKRMWEDHHDGETPFEIDIQYDKTLKPGVIDFGSFLITLRVQAALDHTKEVRTKVTRKSVLKIKITWSSKKQEEQLEKQWVTNKIIRSKPYKPPYDEGLNIFTNVTWGGKYRRRFTSEVEFLDYIVLAAKDGTWIGETDSIFPDPGY